MQFLNTQFSPSSVTSPLLVPKTNLLSDNLTSVFLATRQSFPPISNYSSMYYIALLGGEEGENMQESVT